MIRKVFPKEGTQKQVIYMNMGSKERLEYFTKPGSSLGLFDDEGTGCTDRLAGCGVFRLRDIQKLHVSM